MSHITAHGNCL